MNNTIPEEIKNKIRFEANKRFAHSESDNDEFDKILLKMFPDAAEYGYLLAMEEIEHWKNNYNIIFDQSNKIEELDFEIERLKILIGHLKEIKSAADNQQCCPYCGN